MKQQFIQFVALLGLSVTAFAQGTVNFANVAGPATARTVDAPVFGMDRTTRATAPDYAAQLYAGPTASSLTAIGPAVPFMTGSGAGYFLGGTRVIPTVAPGATAVIVVRAWYVPSGPTWETAMAKAESAYITVVTGGAGSPPSIPANLVGLQSFPVMPEPSSMLLACAGMLVLFWKRFRK